MKVVWKKIWIKIKIKKLKNYKKKIIIKKIIFFKIMKVMNE